MLLASLARYSIAGVRQQESRTRNCNYQWLSNAEDRGTDPDAGGTEGNCSLVVAGHAHRQLGDAGFLAKLFQQGKVRTRIFVSRRDAHQALDGEAVHIAAAGDEGDGLARLDAGLLRLGAGVDLDI